MPITILDASHSFAAPLLRKVDIWSDSRRHLVLRQGLTRVALVALPILTLLDVLWHAGAASVDLARLPIQMATGKRTTKVQQHLSYSVRNLATTVAVLIPALAMPWKASSLYETVGHFKGVAPAKGLMDRLRSVWKGASSSLSWKHIAVGVALVAGVAIFLHMRAASTAGTQLPKKPDPSLTTETDPSLTTETDPSLTTETEPSSTETRPSELDTPHVSLNPFKVAGFVLAGTGLLAITGWGIVRSIQAWRKLPVVEPLKIPHEGASVPEGRQPEAGIPTDEEEHTEKKEHKDRLPAHLEEDAEIPGNKKGPSAPSSAGMEDIGEGIGDDEKDRKDSKLNLSGSIPQVTASKEWVVLTEYQHVQGLMKQGFSKTMAIRAVAKARSCWVNRIHPHCLSENEAWEDDMGVLVITSEGFLTEDKRLLKLGDRAFSPDSLARRKDYLGKKGKEGESYSTVLCGIFAGAVMLKMTPLHPLPAALLGLGAVKLIEGSGIDTALKGVAGQISGCAKGVWGRLRRG